MPKTGGAGLARAVAVIAVGLAAAACSSGTGAAARRTTATASTTAAAGARTSPVPTASHLPAAQPPAPAHASPRALPVAPGAGRLPQTRTFPSTTSAAFRDAMDDLWLAVSTGNPRFALPAFFPLAAYQQVKAIPDPAADWHQRLWGDFVLDVAAAHRLAGRGARLLRVVVPAAGPNWVSPGACYNSIGYWHLPGSRVVYQAGGQVRSFGIASLISWRGDWYVVHFGAVLRSVNEGIVDQPAAGEGAPGPPGGC